MKLRKEEDKDHKTLAKEYKRLEIFIIIFMAIAICLGTFYFNVVCFGTECENKSPTPLIIIKPGKSNDNVEKTGEDTGVSILPEGAEYIRNTSARIKINITSEYYECIDVTIENGKLAAKTAKYLRHYDEKERKETLELDNSYNSITKEYSIPNEKVKYIYSLYYQPGGNSIIYALCESGNLYTNNIYAINQTIDALNNFNKTKHTNIFELVKVPTNPDYDNAPDAMPYEIDGLSNGNLTRIETASN